VDAPVSWSSYSAVLVELFGRHGEQLGARFRIAAARRLCPSTRLPTGAGHKTEHRATTRRIDPLLRPRAPSPAPSPLNIDLDLVLTVLANTVCAAMRRRLPGYATTTPDILQRRFLQTSGEILNHDNQITVRRNRRAYSPVLRQAELPTVTVAGPGERAAEWWPRR
jgi:hypothetical protein